MPVEVGESKESVGRTWCESVSSILSLKAVRERGVESRVMTTASTGGGGVSRVERSIKLFITLIFSIWRRWFRGEEVVDGGCWCRIVRLQSWVNARALSQPWLSDLWKGFLGTFELCKLLTLERKASFNCSTRLTLVSTLHSTATDLTGASSEYDAVVRSVVVEDMLFDTGPAKTGLLERLVDWQLSTRGLRFFGGLS